MSNPTLLRDASVAYHLQLIQPWLAAPDVQEICVNRPAELWCERKGQWERHAVEGLSLAHLHGLAKAVARYNDRDVSFETPLLAGNLPQGERIQIVVPPACEQGRLSLTVRKPAATRWGLPELAAQGMFDAAASRHETDEALRRLYARQDVPGFLRLAVRLGKVIVVAGQTGAGKTTLMNALAAEIPAGERIVTIEDVREIRLDDHPNHVHLLHGTAAGRTLPVSELVRAALRMSPSRLLLSELRGAEAFDFLRACSSGHQGGLTTCHADSAASAFDRLALMCLQHPDSRGLRYPVIRRLLDSVIDVVVHLDRGPGNRRHMTDIWFGGRLRSGARGRARPGRRPAASGWPRWPGRS
ncbi:P-type DNA transfer ATPase VirB11 [Bordetella pseudohinzii]|uniref:P-type DNA transfer ATPase VirB11 n=1 Tax=Bordetella pseudohinzii TaxID=1331258 RepID=A0A0J6BZ43_9BORD|nr:P-type DNA transfer ATPase VirB11 [Bordetella pseudohinzii]ANY14727.1 P-type DNA transfer ATPase VirB11 [Bordetella pseudohinzii]KMM26929.1 Type IV secretion system protein PtlI [Bordetella pseudohinzii]CUI59580.1 Pertussis toxin liberation protein H [Bordetella pseudohinzii]